MAYTIYVMKYVTQSTMHGSCFAADEFSINTYLFVQIDVIKNDIYHRGIIQSPKYVEPNLAGVDNLFLLD